MQGDKAPKSSTFLSSDTSSNSIDEKIEQISMTERRFGPQNNSPSLLQLAKQSSQKYQRLNTQTDGATLLRGSLLKQKLFLKKDESLLKQGSYTKESSARIQVTNSCQVLET